MTSTKKLISAVAAVCFVLNVGCGSESNNSSKGQKKTTNISLSWWGTDTRTQYTVEAVKKFEELHPDIKVTCNYSEWAGYEEKFRSSMESGSETDVMQINFSWLDEFSPDGTGFYDLEQLSDTLNYKTINSNFLEYGKKGGVLNAIPIAMNTQVPYYNVTLLESYGLEAPKTWQDLFDDAKVLSRDDIYILSGAAKHMWIYCLVYAEQTTGTTFLIHDNTINFGVDEFKVMIDFYVDLVKNNVVPKVEYFSKNEVTNCKYAGVLAWVSDATGFCGDAIAAGNKFVAGDFTAKNAVETGSCWYAKPATLYAVSKHTEHPQEAAELLDFLLNSPEMASLQGVEKGIPLSSEARDVLKNEGKLSGLQYNAAIKMEENKKISKMNSFIENEWLFEAFMQNCNLVLNSEKTSEEAAQLLYDELYEKYNMVGKEPVTESSSEEGSEETTEETTEENTEETTEETTEKAN